MVKEHSGRVVKLMGDGALAEFASAVNAVACALAVQKRMAEANEGQQPRIDLRIGINLGDAIGEDGDIFGNGVNVAARLESLAKPGGLCILANVHEAVRGRIEFEAEDLGELVLKKIPYPVRAFHVRTRAAYSVSQDSDFRSAQDCRLLCYRL